MVNSQNKSAGGSQAFVREPWGAEAVKISVRPMADLRLCFKLNHECHLAWYLLAVKDWNLFKFENEMIIIDI